MRLNRLTGPLLIVAGLIIVHITLPAAAQTAEQVRQLQQMTPAQRAALLEALGQSTQSGDEPALEEPVVVEPRSSEQNGGNESPIGAATGDNDDDDYPSLEDLRRFGYDLFAGEPTTFAPATDIPVPVDYVIGPGDTVDVQMFGSQNAQYRLVVARDGVLNIPEIGPVMVAGMTFSEMSRALQDRIAEQMIGVKSSITMGPLRSIRVFVLGDAYRPGSYTVSSLSTMTNALFVSGGINKIGSLRNIQLKRSGKVVTTLDLYDLLLNGDTSGDERLKPGDVIFIPPVGPTVGVGGQVRRPAIYELRGERTAAEILSLAGGMLPSAFPDASQISRISEDRTRTIIDVDLSDAGGLATRIEADDLVTVFSVLDKREDIVVLQGHVYRPGPYQWSAGMRLTDLLPTTRDLRPLADLDYIMVRREDPASQRISVLSTSLADALDNDEHDLELQPLDQITVFSLESDRIEYVEPVLSELRLQASRDLPANEVRISGRVRAPGSYPLEPGMRVSDLVRAGGGFRESAYGLDAELTRYEVDDSDQRKTVLLNVDLESAMRGGTGANVVLRPHDILNIKEIPMWKESEFVTIEGEVRFPGSFPIRRGERLSSLLDRAGGLTDLAFPDGAIFLREALREKEEQQILELASRLQSEVESASVADPDSADDAEARRALLEQVRATEATGRLVINLGRIVSGNTAAIGDVELRDGDRLLIPRAEQTVTIIGEVQFPTSHIFEPGVSRDGYIGRSGGTTALADKSRVYIVRANGSVVSSRRSLFFRNRNYNDVRPGDTIVVPIKADPVSSLALWTSVTSIIYNIGVAAAAVASFN